MGSPPSTRPVAGSPDSSAGLRPLFSIVISSYNRAALLVEAVDSALAQTRTDYEVIVVDDGSTDETRKAMAIYGDRIRYIHQENGGLAAARNRGIQASRGEFVAFLDSDDLLDPPFLERVWATFQEHPECGAVFVAERVFVNRDDPPGRVHSKRTPGVHFTSAGLVSRDTGVGSGRPPVIRRHLLERLGGFSETIRCAVDCEMWIRYSFHVPMVLLPEPSIRRRIHPGNLSANRAQDARDWLQIMDWLRREQPEFVNENTDIYRRTLAKQHTRLGRELLAQGGGDPGRLQEARHHLLSAIRTYPYGGRRPYIYLFWALVAPGTYATWRRREIRRGNLRSAPPAT
jgi:hypothetical protein